MTSAIIHSPNNTFICNITDCHDETTTITTSSMNTHNNTSNQGRVPTSCGGSCTTLANTSISHQLSDMDDLIGHYANKLCKLNVGGRRFLTTWSTLIGNSPSENYFSALLRYEHFGGQQTKDDKGFLFIDRSPTYFEFILEYLRTGRFFCPPHLCLESLIEEAQFFGIPVEEETPTESLSDRIIRQMIQSREEKNMSLDIQRNIEILDKLKAVLFKSFVQLVEEDKPLQVQFWPAAATVLSAAVPLVNRSPTRDTTQLENLLNQFLPDNSAVVKSDQLWNGLSVAREALIHAFKTIHNLSIKIEKCYIYVGILADGTWQVTHAPSTNTAPRQLGRAQFDGFIVHWEGHKVAA